jgi:hypothetical protein
VLHARASCGEGDGEVLEDLPHLGARIVFSDKPSLLIQRYLPGNDQDAPLNATAWL